VRTAKPKAAAAARIGTAPARRKRVELLELLRPCFARTEPWLQAGKYAAAVMSQIPGRNGWTIAAQTGEGSMTHGRLAFGFLRSTMQNSPLCTAAVQLLTGRADAHSGGPARGDQGMFAPLASHQVMAWRCCPTACFSLLHKPRPRLQRRNIWGCF
jgi:hypothetical protein